MLSKTNYMNQTEIILQRIKKLIKHSESAKQLGSLEEAEAFMTKATELMIEYNLSIFQVESTEEKQPDEFKNYGYSERLSFDDKHQGWQWKFKLIHILAEYNFTGFTYNPRNKTFTVHGRMENVDTTIWLYNYLMIGLYNLAQDKYKVELAHKRTYDKEAALRFSKVEAYMFKKDFLIGAVDGFEAQLYEQRKNQPNTVTALVKFNTAQLTKFLYKTKPFVKSVDTNISVNHKTNGYSFGYAAGNKFNVNKPLPSSPKQKEIK